MNKELEQFIDFFKKTTGTGLLVCKNDIQDLDIKHYLDTQDFKIINIVSNITPQINSCALFFKKEDITQIYNVFKQVSEGLSMLTIKDKNMPNSDVIHVDPANFRLALIMKEEDLVYAQNYKEYDFINCANMIEYII